MSQRQTTFTNGEYYHVYNRGNSKQTIFHDKQDIEYFQSLLFLFNKKDRAKKSNLKNSYAQEKSGEPLVSIGAYCLMPNHFHILLKQEQDDGVSAFLQKVSTGYVMYYNKKYKRTGSLFEGKFRARHAQEDRYLKYLFAYIHLNPLKILDTEWKLRARSLSKKYLQFLMTYAGSSFLDYVKSGRAEEIILNKTAFPKYFPSRNSFFKEITSWISINSSDF